MINVIVLGYGNVGSHLTEMFDASHSINLIQVYNRSIESIQHLKQKCFITDNLNDLLDADVYIISVPDDVISSFSKALNLTDKLIVHTSGSVDMESIMTLRKGVFYPLQTFTKNQPIAYKNSPICVEANNNKDLVLIEQLASEISTNTYILDSEQRKKMHLAAVFVNNFVNHLYHIGLEICEENQVPFEILHPLIEETFNKIKNVNPVDAQTGPAKRNDLETIKKQLLQLTVERQKLYNSLTGSIIKTYT